MVERDELRGQATERAPEQVRLLDPRGIEHRHRIGGNVGDGIGQPRFLPRSHRGGDPRRIGRRSVEPGRKAGIALIEPHDAEAPGHQHRTERVGKVDALPPCAVEQQHWGSASLAERLPEQSYRAVLGPGHRQVPVNTGARFSITAVRASTASLVLDRRTVLLCSMR
jgi:hypothetical protein